jgi:rare lipoprotein A
VNADRSTRGAATARLAGLAILMLAAMACGGKKQPDAVPSHGRHVETGEASWYGKKFHGRTTASGVRYDMHNMTAAHPTLPFGARVTVTNLENGRTVEVTINDRGPFVKGRIIDLSYAAAKKLGMVDRGVARVRVTRL